MKLNILKPVLTAIVLILGLAGCSDDNWSMDDKMPKGQGQVSLNDFGITLKDVSNVNPTRAGEDVSSFIVEILRASDNSIVKSYTFSDIPELITLPAGDYVAKAYSHNMQPAEWDKPYYEGTKEFKIEAGKIINIGTVTCKFASIKVTIEYTKELMDLMGDDCSIDVDYNYGTVLTFTPQETRAGYFKPVENGTTMVATISGTINSQHEEIPMTLKDVAAGQWRLIKIDAKNADTSHSNLTGGATHVDDGTGNSGIQLSFTVEDKGIDGSLKIEEDIINVERPGHEVLPVDPGTDPNPGTDPSTDPNTPSSDPISFQYTFDATKVNETVAGTYIVTIHSVNGISNIDVTIDSDGLTPADLEDVELAAQFDLAHPGDLEEGLNNLGFPTGDDVIGKTELEFNISKFVPMLGMFSGNHNFILKVTDSTGESASTTIRFKS